MPRPRPARHAFLLGSNASNNGDERKTGHSAVYSLISTLLLSIVYTLQSCYKRELQPNQNLAGSLVHNMGSCYHPGSTTGSPMSFASS